jgi:hypothetical protein
VGWLREHGFAEAACKMAYWSECHPPHQPPGPELGVSPAAPLGDRRARLSTYLVIEIRHIWSSVIHPVLDGRLESSGGEVFELV